MDDLDLDRIQRLAEEFESDPSLPEWAEEQLHTLLVVMDGWPPGSG